MLTETLFGSAPLSAAADEAFLSLAALAASAVDIDGDTDRCAMRFPCRHFFLLRSADLAAERVAATAQVTHAGHDGHRSTCGTHPNVEISLCDGGSGGSRLDRIDVPATRHALQTARRLARDAAAGAKLSPAQQVHAGAASPQRFREPERHVFAVHLDV